MKKALYPILNPEGTGYLRDNKPCFSKIWLVAQSFHAPEDLAAVRDQSGAYHICLTGQEAYSHRYQSTFGFYGGIATVKDQEGYFHIDKEGNPIHSRRFFWSGNYQEACCAVQDDTGFYHIDEQGNALYQERFSYVGDFRHGISVVRKANIAWHIQKNGNKLHPHQFLHADVYHKGFAVAQDRHGYFHIDAKGSELYTHRFATLEPFYNGAALASTFSGHWARINQSGHYCLLAPTPAFLTGDELKERLKNGERVVMILRHSEREKIPKNSWGTESPLTEAGKEYARQLGEKLKTNISWQFISSPVGRCIDTCSAFAQGLGQILCRESIPTSPLLGEPGAFHDPVSPPSLTPENFMESATRYVLEGFSPGFRPLTDGCQDILDFAGRAAKIAPTLFCTHDFFIAGLFAFLSLHRPTREEWVEFLEGICLFYHENTLTEWRRFQGLKEV